MRKFDISKYLSLISRYDYLNHTKMFDFLICKKMSALFPCKQNNVMINAVITNFDDKKHVWKQSHCWIVLEICLFRNFSSKLRFWFDLRFHRKGSSKSVHWFIGKSKKKTSLNCKILPSSVVASRILYWFHEKSEW